MNLLASTMTVICSRCPTQCDHTHFCYNPVDSDIVLLYCDHTHFCYNPVDSDIVLLYEMRGVTVLPYFANTPYCFAETPQHLLKQTKRTGKRGRLEIIGTPYYHMGRKCTVLRPDEASRHASTSQSAWKDSATSSTNYA